MKKLFLFLLNILAFSVILCAQNDSLALKYNMGALVHLNAGINGSGNLDYNSRDQLGQEFLGYVGISREVGLEFLVFHKSGIALKGDLHKSRILFAENQRGLISYVDGTWYGNGKSLGVGYGFVEGKGNPNFTFFTSLSFGTYLSQWTFENTDYGEVLFGIK